MFDHVVLRRAVQGSPISVGQIAEALFYYQKVQLFLDPGTLLSILKKISAGEFLTLLSRHDLSAVYCEEQLGTHTEGIGVMQSHNFVAFSISSGPNGNHLATTGDRLQYLMGNNGFSKKESRTFAKQFFKRVPVRKISGNHFIEGGVCKAAQEDLSDITFASQAARCAVVAAPGGYDPGDALSFEIVRTAIGNFASTNIDFETINQRRSGLSAGVHDPLTVAHILSSILDARADLALAAYYGGDFITSQLTSSIIQTRYSEFLRRAQLNADAQRQFMEIGVPDAPGIAEVIDSGQRSLSDFLRLMDKADRFKAWLKSVNPDEGLVREYVQAMKSEAPVQGIPSKSIRYVLATTIGDIGFMAGAMAGFADTFITDRLLGGWRPNHFVERKLVPFVKC